MFAASWIPASSACATTFADASLEELAAASDLIVFGQVEAVVVESAGPAGQPGIHTRALVRVDDVLSGRCGKWIEVWLHGGELGNSRRVIPGQATLREGQRVALFLFEAGGGLWPTGLGRGVFERDQAGQYRPTVASTSRGRITGAGLRRIVGR